MEIRGNISGLGSLSFVKIFVTGLLATVMLFQIYRTARHFDKVKVKARQSYLNELREHARPLDYLIDVVTQNKAFVPTALEQYIYYYSKVIEYMPHRADAHGMRGFFYYHAGRQEEAVHAYEKAIELNPRFFWYRYNLAVIHFRQGRTREALEYFQEAVNMDPKATVEFVLFSREIYVPLLAKRQARGEDLLRMLNAGRETSFKGMVLSAVSLQNHAAVLTLCRYALDHRFPEEGFFIYYAGLAAYHLGEPVRAVPWLEESVRRYPDSVEVYQVLAQAFKALGREAEAAQVLAAGARIPPSDKKTPFNEDDIRLEIF